MTVANTLSLLELAKRHDPNGNTAAIAEVLTEENQMLQDAVWQEANDTFSHKYTRRLSLPTGTHRKLNFGVPVEASRTVEGRDTVAFLESYSQCDKKLCDAAASPSEFRMNEATSFLEGMGQTMAGKMIYGNTALVPEEPLGLAPRMAAVASTNVIDAGGSIGTSIYVVMWGPTKAFMVYPRNHPNVGIVHKDLGEVTLTDASGGMYQGYRDHFETNYGLCVKDDRSTGRICEIEPAGVANIFDEDDLITLLNLMPSGPKVIYCNGTVKTQMDIALKDKTNVNYTAQGGEGLAGEPVLHFKGYPIRRVDQILDTEAAVA